VNRTKKLNQLASICKLSRRQFILRALATGLTLPAAQALYVSAARASPVKGGHFRFGLGSGSTTDTLDPGLATSTFIQSLCMTTNGYLTEVSPEGNLVGALAESWDASKDAKSWTFRLNKGAEFHNGKSVEAADVVASINYHRNADSKSGGKGVVDQIEDVKADGPGAVVFSLKVGNADFPFLVSDYHLAIKPSNNGSIDGTSAIGCGGYAVKSFEPGIRAELVRHANYWKPDRAWFDTAEYLAITDVAARTNALTTGQIDAMDRCDLKTVALLKSNSALEMMSVTGMQHITLPMLTDVPPFDDNNVRMALKLAIRRSEWVEKILFGHGALGNDQPINAAYRYFDTNLPQREYDPDQAKHYLRKSGHDRLKVQLHTSEAAFVGAVDAAVLYKESAAAAGIDIDVVRHPSDGFWEQVWMKEPFSFSYWGGRPTEDWMFTAVYAHGASMNETHWDNGRFNELLLAARAELDSDKRRAMYTEMQQICRDQGGALIPMFANYVNAISTRVGHGTIAKNWDVDGLLAVERWWFKSA
jgi:peptide/nickel transport system substrate-binding protein